MATILVAGASGQLGQQVVRVLKQQGHRVRMLARNMAHAASIGADVRPGDLTRPETLNGVCVEVEYIVSCAGASMRMSGLGNRQGFYEVDWQGNANLLAEAQRAAVQKFVYVSLAGAEKLRHVVYADAHARFVETLRASQFPHTVVSPTGFFGFLLEILKFAQQGRGLLIGAGSCRTNPIHEADVARACLDALTSGETELTVGGPEVFTRREITELAFAVLQRQPKLMSISPGLFNALISPLKPLNPRLHALLDFGRAVTQLDCLAPAYGTQRLGDYFAQAVGQLER